MAKPFQSNYRKVSLYKSKYEFEEFGPGKRGLIVCRQCEAVYYKKRWHHSWEKLNFPESINLAKVKKGGSSVKFVLCPACQMIKNHQYEGILTIKNVPAKLKKELIGFINGFCRRAYERDPMDRLIGIKDGKELIVTVTENELANKLGKKIQNLFNNVKTKTIFSPEPSDVARVTVEFLSK
jgi:NMD protein affecting ribosome stability and mRNA decay